MKKIFTLLAFTLISISLKAQYGQPCTDLFISEYVSPKTPGTLGNKAIEIYNPSATAINLSGYLLKQISNGNCSGSIPTFHFPNKNLAAGDVYVIANGAGTLDPAVIAAKDTTYGSFNFNGNDALFLINPNGDTLDVFGQLCLNPGTAWLLSSGDSTRYMTLVRKPTVHNGQRNFSLWQNEWIAYPFNTFSYLGSHTMNACSTTTPQVSFTMPAQSVYESAGLLNIPVVLNSSCPNTVTVDVQVAFGTATLGSDYTYTNQTLTFAANSTSPQYDTIRIIDDALVESTETVKLRLLNPTNGAVLGADSFQYVSIIDNDFTTPTFYLAAPQNVSVTEQLKYIPIIVYLGSPPATASTIDVKFKSGNASNVTDYNFITQTLHFAANSIGPDTAYIKVLDDCIPEGLDSVWLVLSNPSTGCTIGNDSIFQLKIIDNDAIPSVSFSSTTPSLLENFGTYNLNVSIATPNCDTTKVTVNVVGGSAIAGTDYNATFPTTVVFPPNSTTTQQIPIQIIDDNIVEPKDSILLQITSVTNGATINIANKKIYIIDNDTLPVATVSFVNTSVADTENVGSVAIPFTIANPLNVASHLYYTVSGTCTNGSDYTINGSSISPISIAANATTGNISVNIIDDNLLEGNEVIIFKLDSMKGGKVGTNKTFNLYVIDNDATGLNNFESQNNVKLYPNPVTSDGIIYFANLAKTNNRIEFYNLLGMKVCAENVAQNKFNLANKGFQKGIYFYKINDANGALLKEGKLIVE